VQVSTATILSIGDSSWDGSTEKAEKLLGFRGKVQLDEGLKSVVDWRMQDSNWKQARAA
jgi:nucleoside-diphosphate-sugar epimerase